MFKRIKGYVNTKKKPDPRYKGGEAYAKAVEK